MMRCHAHSRISVSSVFAFAGVIAVGVSTAAVAQDVSAGQRIWANKAGCPQCHGWSGDGHVSGFESPGGLPLRTTQLTRDQIREVIQCGRPGTPMPHFDRFAYTDKRCYDMTAADLGNLEAIRADTTLQPFEIDALATTSPPRSRGRAQ